MSAHRTCLLVCVSSYYNRLLGPLVLKRTLLGSSSRFVARAPAQPPPINGAIIAPLGLEVWIWVEKAFFEVRGRLVIFLSVQILFM